MAFFAAKSSMSQLLMMSCSWKPKIAWPVALQAIKRQPGIQSSILTGRHTAFLLAS
jgi:hypothetical protein